MKVSELKKGMLLECASDDHMFMLSSNSYSAKRNEPQWLNVVKRRRTSVYFQSTFDKRVRSEKFIMYLGTKKDTSIDMQWCDKFVMIGSTIAGVEPAAWSKLRSIDEDR